jgi:sortase A
MVVEGVRPRDLKLAAGHVPGTAMPEAAGNVVIAGHRDTFFRKLREVQPRDLITLTTFTGSYRYSVEWTRIVEPEDVEVTEASNEPLLTLVTCYPFFYLGSAPERFIVRARRLGGG